MLAQARDFLYPSLVTLPLLLARRPHGNRIVALVRALGNVYCCESRVHCWLLRAPRSLHREL